MWFKNLQIFRLTKDFQETEESLNEKLESFSFKPCQKQQNQSSGWISPAPTDKDMLVYSCNQNLLLCLKKQEKILPTSVINEKLNEKVSLIEEQEQRKLSHKEKNKLKDEVTFDLLPQAFTKAAVTHAYIAPNEKLIYINASSASKAEELINNIREALGSFAVIPLNGKNTTLQTMTEWINQKQPPEKFSLGSECELMDFQDESVIKYKNHDLFADEIISHIHSGHSVKQIALNWQDKLQLMLDDKMAVKRIKFSDYFQEQLEGIESDNAMATFDADFSIMSAEFKSFVSDLVKAFGGFGEISDNIVAEKILAAESSD